MEIELQDHRGEDEMEISLDDGPYPEIRSQQTNLTTVLYPYTSIIKPSAENSFLNNFGQSTFNSNGGRQDISHKTCKLEEFSYEKDIMRTKKNQLINTIGLTSIMTINNLDIIRTTNLKLTQIVKCRAKFERIKIGFKCTLMVSGIYITFSFMIILLFTLYTAFVAISISPILAYICAELFMLLFNILAIMRNIGYIEHIREKELNRWKYIHFLLLFMQFIILIVIILCNTFHKLTSGVSSFVTHPNACLEFDECYYSITIFYILISLLLKLLLGTIIQIFLVLFVMTYEKLELFKLEQGELPIEYQVQIISHKLRNLAEPYKL